MVSTRSPARRVEQQLERPRRPPDGDPTGGPPARSGRPPAQAFRPAGDQPSEEELRQLARELSETPVEDIIANHCYGLFELAALHLSQQPVNLVAARLAIDAMGQLVDGLGERLGAARRHPRRRAHPAPARLRAHRRGRPAATEGRRPPAAAATGAAVRGLTGPSTTGET